MAYKLIITADDYGINRAVDDAIINAIDLGLINSVTVLMNFERSVPALKRLVRFLDRRGWVDKVGVGIHLNVVTGKAITTTHNGLLVKNDLGDFYTSAHYFNSDNKKLLNQIQINRELYAQVDLFLTSIEDTGIDVPLDHFTSQFNALHNIDKFAVVVGSLSYYYSAHGKYPGKPIPLRRPLPVGMELKDIRGVTRMWRETRKYITRDIFNKQLGELTFALGNLNRAELLEVADGIFKYNGIVCPHLMFFSFFASGYFIERGDNNPPVPVSKIGQLIQLLPAFYEASISSGKINDGDDLYIEVVHHIGRLPNPDELMEASEISGFNFEYFETYRKYEYDLIRSSEYRVLLNHPEVSMGNYSDMNA